MDYYIPFCSGTLNKDLSYGGNDGNEDIIQSRRTKCCLWKRIKMLFTEEDQNTVLVKAIIPTLQQKVISVLNN